MCSKQLWIEVPIRITVNEAVLNILMADGIVLALTATQSCAERRMRTTSKIIASIIARAVMMQCGHNQNVTVAHTVVALGKRLTVEGICAGGCSCVDVSCIAAFLWYIRVCSRGFHVSKFLLLAS